jgi:hypothetical protein
VFPSHTRTAAQVIGELLARHPEAASLLGEAGHCQALAGTSAARKGETLAAARAARLAYEEARHRLDPRRRQTVAFGTGVLVLALLGAGLMLLDGIDLSGLLGLAGSVLPALVAAIAWLAGGWMAALASRERHWPALLALAVAALILGLLLATLHGTSHRSLLLGLLVSAFILALAAGAAVLMASMEPGPVFVARGRWRRARAAHAAAVRVARSDREMAAVATESWLSLVRSRASTLADDGQLARETLVLAAELLHGGQAQLPPAAADEAP